jgi:hypothetical protein
MAELVRFVIKNFFSFLPTIMQCPTFSLPSSPNSVSQDQFSYVVLRMELPKAPKTLGWQSKIANLKSRIDISPTSIHKTGDRPLAPGLVSG